MPEITTVANIQEAVELAQSFKSQGRYNWFRGQVRDWPPYSSLARQFITGGQAKLDLAKERYLGFCNWLGEQPGLSYLLDGKYIHQFFAVAQHYGIPTHYIDFTTDPAVAGFFSADTSEAVTEGMSCIYCLDTQDLLSLWDDLKKIGAREEGRIEAVEVDVTNLWRLQAQRGAFLFADYNWDVDYPMDRILFPYSGYPAYPSKDYIYPKEKSALELLLDQYFDIETKHFGNRWMNEFLDEMKAKGGPAAVRLTSKGLENGFSAAAFADPAKLTRLSSWDAPQLSAWRAYPDERYDSVGGHVEYIHLNASDRASLERAVSFGVKQLLDARPQLRGKLVEWVLKGATGALPVEKLGGLFRSVWSGMRFLPYSNAQIAAALANVAGLACAGLSAGRQSAEDSRSFEDVSGARFLVEFAYADSSSSRGYVRKDAVRAAMRSDIRELLKPEHRAQLDEVKTMFFLVQNPALLFEFEPLVDVFARDLIPSQIALERKPVLFDPSSLAIFGLP